MKLIGEKAYLSAVRKLITALKQIHSDKKFDAVVAPKRSGFFLGVWASHALGLPLFASAELRAIPAKFDTIVVVDTAVCTGKTLGKIRRQLRPRTVFTAVIWREGAGEADFILEPEAIGLIKFFYEEGL